jgi:hypothetical protein
MKGNSPLAKKLQMSQYIKNPENPIDHVRKKYLLLSRSDDMFFFGQACPACPAVPRETYASDSETYYTGVGPEDRTGVSLPALPAP